jgi:hypothetical protein
VHARERWLGLVLNEEALTSMAGFARLADHDDDRRAMATIGFGSIDGRFYLSIFYSLSSVFASPIS